MRSLWLFLFVVFVLLHPAIGGELMRNAVSDKEPESWGLD